ncbi:MAG: rhodanese-like domain-containing protein, partial [Chitinophagales bacterium]
VASTGLNEASLKRENIPYAASYTHPAPYATYYPGGRTMAIKLLFDPEKGTILGAQILGFQGVDKRIDVLATCIKNNQTVFDLQELELAYAPPFSSAKDPINMAGYVAGNIVKGDMEVFHWNQIEDFAVSDSLLLDVRTPAEFAQGVIPGAVNIPVDELRQRINEIPKDKLILVYCRVGLRGYIAYRILKQMGYQRVKNLSGGWLTYEAARQ